MKVTKIAFKSALTENHKAANIVPFTHGFQPYDVFAMAMYKMGLGDLI